MIDTGDANLDAIVDGLLHGQTDVESTEITYTFALPTSLAGVEGYSALNQASIDRHLAVFASVSTFTGATFREVDPIEEVPSFTFTFLEDVATAYVVDFEGSTLHVYNPERDQPELGSYTDHLILHEVGHALGLEHGHEFNGTPREYQGHSWSVMSYRAHPDTESLFYTDSHGPETYMIADIAALQYLYGANFETQAGDTTYTVNFLTGEFFIDGVGQGVPINREVLRTIWDGAGNDTLDLSNALSRLEIDLQPGAFTSFGDMFLAYQGQNEQGQALYAEGNLANPYLYQGNTSSLLENAIGGRFSDKIVGNVADNRLEGRGGNDSIFGLVGDDELIGGDGNDLIIDGVGDTTAAGDAGDDFVIVLSGTGSLTGGDDNDILVGGIDNDVLDGGAGNDVLRGDAGHAFLFGADQLIGGTGDDLLMGGRGADEFIFTPNSGEDTIAAVKSTDLAPGEIGSVAPEGADFRSGIDLIVLQDFVDVTEENVMSFVADDPDTGHAVFSAEGTLVHFFALTMDQIAAEDFMFL
ncbi:MAG: M10 family metallopeptidase C-terminal domain-containing protein [Pseudomonadota bacterium]